MTVSSQKRILCIFKKSPNYNKFTDHLLSKEYFVYDYPATTEAMGLIYNDPPDVILLSADVKDWKKFLLTIKKDPVYGHLPLILILPINFKKNLISLMELPVDDWIFANSGVDELFVRIRMREIFSKSDLDANPLTRLPGNYSIMKTIQSRIDCNEDFGLGYLDIDNFKAFNDKNGFAHGDDMIRMTARILTNVVRRITPKNSFVGHIGGDDFVFIVEPKNIEKCCIQIIQNFDIVSTTLSNDEDRVRGYIETEDRQGKFRKFPLPSLSLACIDSSVTKINHPGEAASLAGEIKKEVKKKSGSNYFIDRRTK